MLPFLFLVKQKNVFAGEKQSGLHVIVWNEDATVLDFKVFKDLTETQDFFTSMYKHHNVQRMRLTSR